MPAKSLQDLFVEELRDIYDGEKRLLRAIPKMAKAADSGELQTAFTTHAKETATQVRRLEQVFKTMGEKPRGKKCDGILGIIEEGTRSIRELDGPVLDAALIAGAQKVEHYEIATYGTLAYFADLLGQDTAKELLGETLEEEKATDERLSELAKSEVNREALRGRPEEQEERSGTSYSMTRRARRAAASGGIASERPAHPPSSRRRGTGGRRSRGKRPRS